MRKLQNHILLIMIALCYVPMFAHAGSSVNELHIYKGSTPLLDGTISPGEWDDAVSFTGTGDWTEELNTGNLNQDLSVKGWIKHDGKKLYIALDITDDVIYGIESDRWLPEGKTNVLDLEGRGTPWFGDSVEIMFNASNIWPLEDQQSPAGDGSCWQMVCNLTRSVLGGQAGGGLIAADVKPDSSAWQSYIKWINNGDQKAVIKLQPGGNNYVVEWVIQPDPCLEIKPGLFWTPDMGTTRMGFNMAIYDADQKDKGKGPFNLNHVKFWAGMKSKGSQPSQWGTLVIHPNTKPVEIHVAPDGLDTNPGTSAKPLKTLDRARQLVREAIDMNLKCEIMVVIHYDMYLLPRPFVITPEDSSRTDCDIIYASGNGYEYKSNSRAVLSGGRLITGWKQDEGNKWTVRLDEVAEGIWNFRQLFKDGSRLPISRYPNGQDLLHLTNVSNNYTQLDLDKVLPFDLSGRDAEMIVLQNWSISRCVVGSNSGNTITTKDPMAWVGHSACCARKGMGCFLENALEFVDQPGEWYLDTDTGILTYMARENENPNDHEFLAPAVEKLLLINGSADEPVKNITFRRIAFSHAKWNLPEFGYRGIQAGYHGTIAGQQPVFGLPSAVEMAYAENCSLIQCDISHTGATGIGFGAGTSKNRILGCRVYDIGGNGIDFGHRTKALKTLYADWENDAQIPKGNIVSNSHLWDCGTISYGAVGIYSAFTRDTVITHNIVNNMPYTGISVGFIWNQNPTSQKTNIVKYNHVYDVMRFLADGGCIYTLGNQPGTVLKNNLLHDVHRSVFAHGGAPNNGIFFDEGSSKIHVEENIIYNTSGLPVRFNQTGKQNMTWKNNFFGISPADSDYPKYIADKAGPDPFWDSRVR